MRPDGAGLRAHDRLLGMQKTDPTEHWRARTDEPVSELRERLERLLVEQPGSLELVVDVVCPSIGSTQTTFDIACDILDVLMVRARLLAHSKQQSVGWWNEGHSAMVRLRLRVPELRPFAMVLMEVVESLTMDDDELTDAWMCDRQELEATLATDPPDVPWLVDDFWGNLLTAEHDLEPEAVSWAFEFHPEWAQGWLRSSASRHLGFPMWSGSQAWVLPATADANRVSRVYFCEGEGEDSPFLPAERVRIGDEAELVMHEWGSRVWPGELIERLRTSVGSLPALAPFDLKAARIRMTKDTGLLSVPIGPWQLIVFASRMRSVSEAELQELGRVAATIQRLFLPGSPVPWERLGAARFEELCYDVARECGEFQPWGVYRMGLTNARDGGRDLFMYSRDSQFGGENRWIGQCKYTQKASIGRSAVVDVGDTLDSHRVKNYCFFTSAIVDSTLFDKLTGVVASRGGLLRIWSRPELERFLACRPHLMSEYFGP